MNSPRLFAVLTNCICKQEIRSKATWEEEGEKQEQARERAWGGQAYKNNI